MKAIFNRIIFFIIIVLFTSFSGLLAQEKFHIAIIELEAQGGLSQQEAGILTNRLRSKLVATNVFILLDRGQMESILEEQGFQATGCTSTECAVEIGQLLNVEWMVTGTIGKIGRMYTLDIISIDIQTGQILKSITRDYTGEIEGLIAIMSSIASELAGKDDPVTAAVVNTPPPVTKIIEYGGIQVISEPQGAMLFIDDIKLGLTPYKLDELKTGEHRIKLSKIGCLDSLTVVNIEAGEISNVNIDLKKINKIYLKSKPKGAAIYLNGELLGSTPYNFELPSGKYTFKFKKSGYIDWKKEIAINDDFNQTIQLMKLFKISITTTPDNAQVFFDNKYAGLTPLSGELAQGSYFTRIHLNNYEDYEKYINVDRNMKINYKLEHTQEYKQQLKAEKGGGGFFGKAIVVAAIVGGGYYYYMTELAPAQDTGFPIPVGRP